MGKKTFSQSSGEWKAILKEVYKNCLAKDFMIVTAEEYDNDADDSTVYHVDECPKQRSGGSQKICRSCYD